MKKNKSSISKKKFYLEIGEFWDTHNLSDHWDKGKDVNFEIDLDSDRTYYSLDNKISKKVISIAKKEGISPNISVNLWVQEKLQQQFINY